MIFVIWMESVRSPSHVGSWHWLVPGCWPHPCLPWSQCVYCHTSCRLLLSSWSIVPHPRMIRTFQAEESSVLFHLFRCCSLPTVLQDLLNSSQRQFDTSSHVLCITLQQSSSSNYSDNEYCWVWWWKAGVVKCWVKLLSWVVM